MPACWSVTFKLTDSEEGCGISTRSNPCACLLLLKSLHLTMQHYLNNYSMRRSTGSFLILDELCTSDAISVSSFITMVPRHLQSYTQDLMCTLPRDTLNFAIWLIEKRVNDTVSNASFVGLNANVFELCRHFTKLFGDCSTDGSADNYCGVSLSSARISSLLHQCTASMLRLQVFITKWQPDELHQ
jgi:hypothetical protein